MLLLNNKITNIGKYPQGTITNLSVGYSLVDVNATWYRVNDVGADVLTEITDPMLINQLKFLVNTIHSDGTVRMYGSGTDYLSTPISGDDLENFILGAKFVAKQNAALAFGKRYATLVSAETELERSTWSQQLAEAKALQADANAPTPLLTALATARNITVAEYADNVVTASSRYAAQQAALVTELKTEYQKIDDAATAQAVKDTGWL